jgi:two-component system response regulator AtoC
MDDRRGEDEQSAPPHLPGGGTMQVIEARYIADLLKQHGGHRVKVAKALGISERTLYCKLKRYGLT